MATRRFETHTERARHAKRESRYIDFKRGFDPSSKAEFIELIKDFAAMANSGGGAVVIGVDNDGTRSGGPIAPALALDPATITDKMLSYTGQHFADFTITEIRRGNSKAAVIEVGQASDGLLVFSKPGTYADPGKPSKQKTAFSRGTIYFRHGAKSEPAASADIERYVDDRLDRIRTKWLGDIKRVVTAPWETEIAVIERLEADSEGRPTEIRLSDDPNAPIFGMLDPDRTHPYRQTELIDQVNELRKSGRRLNAHDILSVRRAHGLTPDTHPEFIHKMKFGSPQYSDAFADWLALKPDSFFDAARHRYFEMSR